MTATVLQWRPRRAWHVEAKRNKTSPSGSVAVGFGVRVGFWPCLKAPFLQVEVFRWHVSVWHGYAAAWRDFQMLRAGLQTAIDEVK